MLQRLLFVIAIGLASIVSAGCGSALQQHRVQQCVNVPVGCPIPDIEKAKLEQIHQEDDYNTVLNKLIRNYGLLKEENAKLWEIIEMCRRLDESKQITNSTNRKAQ